MWCPCNEEALHPVTSTGIAPSILDTVDKANERCPQAGAVDSAERASYLNNVSLGRAKPSDKKQADAILQHAGNACARQRNAALLQAATGGGMSTSTSG